MKTQVKHPETKSCFSFILIIALIYLPAFTLQAQTIRYVKAIATGNGSGSDWSNASSDLQLMINNSVDGDRIYIAEGTYKPIRPANFLTIISPTNRENAFVLKPGVTLTGGFSNTGVGGVDASGVVLSGDIGVAGDNTDNCYHVVAAVRPSGAPGGTEVRMEFLTIADGNANGSAVTLVNNIFIAQNYGGGSFAYYMHIDLYGCIYRNNRAADRGGGMYSAGLGPFVRSTVFTDNSSVIYGGGLFADLGLTQVQGGLFQNNTANYGGGMYSLSGTIIVSQVTLTNNTAGEYGGAIFNNTSTFKSEYATFTNNAVGVSGGAIYNHNTRSTSQVWFTTFTGNSAQNKGGAITNAGSSIIDIENSTFTGNASVNHGGAIYSENGTTPNITKSSFTSNQSAFGGALLNEAAGYIRNCSFKANTANAYGGAIYQAGASVYMNCLVSGNATINPGGGGAGFFLNGSSPVLVNCTISGNRDSDNGVHAGGIHMLNTSPVLRNCIIWDNSSGWSAESSAYNASYNISQNALAGTMNSTANPFFKESPPAATAPFTGGDYRVFYCSPAVNTGDNSVNTPDNVTDLAGGPRSIFGVDRGAYERALILLPDRKIYVRKGYTGGNGSGDSWANAVDDLTDALISAKSNEIYWSATDPLKIFVSCGTYKPRSRADDICNADPNDRRNAFVMVKNVQLYGGFDPANGIDDLSDTRIFGENGTILSGDIGSAATTDNCMHVIISAGDAGVGLLDGFTVTKGYTSMFPEQVRVNSLLIYELNGAGMYNIRSSPAITNCIFIDNKQDTTNGYRFEGAGMYNDLSSPVINKCAFYSNVSEVGGGMYNFHRSSPTITNSIFAGNIATDFGGGIAVRDTCTPIFINCIMAGNVVTNQSNAKGSALFNYIACSTQVINCTIAGNWEPNPGDGSFHNLNRSDIFFSNCIFWGNHSGIGGDGTTPVPNGIFQSGALGGFNYNPRFLNAPHYSTAPFTNFDYRVEPCSPAINFGSNNLVSPASATDINGQTRIQFDYVDLGAYESIASIATSPGLPPRDTAVMQFQLANGTTTYTTHCNTIIMSITGDGTANAISGHTLVRTWLQPVQPIQFVRRHYQIVPPGSSTTATGTVTLYFTQEDFDAFNAINEAKLPQHPSDAPGKANLLVEKRPSSSSNNTGLPASYTGIATTINPNDANIVWNAVALRWEVTFPITGLGGLWVKTVGSALPLKLLNFTAQENNCTATIEWKTAEEVNVSHFEVEQSTNGTSFNTITTTPAKNTSLENTYAVAIPVTDNKTFYRLKMVDIDSRITYSQTVLVNASCNNRIILYPTPATDKLYIRNVNPGSTYIIYDNTGKAISQGRIINPVHEVHINGIAPGIYYINLADTGGSSKKLRFVKE